jgi:6-phosphogluconolactonase
MARENLLDHVPIPSSRIFRIRGEVNPVLEAARYAEVCHQHIGRHEGVPQADLIMLGLGEDGHTASVFPSDISLFGSDKLFEVALHPGTSQQRITMTGKVINQAKLVVFLATGESKAARVAQVINRLSGWDLLPASMVSPEYGELTWLLDHGAASRLNSV